MRPSLAAAVLSSALIVCAAAAQEHRDAAPADAAPTLAAPPTDTAAVAPIAEGTVDGAATATRAAPHAPRVTHTKSVAPHRTTPHRTTRTPPRPDIGDGTSLSIGRHNRGRLLRGHELTESASLRFKTPHQEARFGTDELVALLERASRRVMERTPGSRLTVGNLSNRGGGRFRPHRSHQSGRDVDLAFYTTDPAGAPLMLDRFYDFRRDLSVRGHDEIHFDLARNWQLVEAMITDEVPVQWIFVCRYIRARLLEEGVRQGASAEVMTHAEAILSQPSHGGLHNDQFHVRIFCPASDHPRCLDDPPIHPWMQPEPTVEIDLRDPSEGE